jgi:hypothetical protein
VNWRLHVRTNEGCGCIRLVEVIIVGIGRIEAGGGDFVARKGWYLRRSHKMTIGIHATRLKPVPCPGTENFHFGGVVRE